MPITNPSLFQGEQSFGTTAGAPLSTDTNNQLVSGLTVSTVSSAVNATTTSATDVLLTTMNLTPVAGTYMAFFDTSVQSTAGGNSITISIYSAGVQIANSSRVVQFPTATLISSGNPTSVATHAPNIVVNGAQAITVQWHTNGGTATCLTRTLSLLRTA